MPTPPPGYLEKVGELAYAVADLEWAIVGDGRVAMAGIDQVELLGLSTGQIGRKLQAAAVDLAARPRIQLFVATSADALIDVADRRNAVLHARPYRSPEGEMLLLRLRRGKDGEPERFWITFEHLDEQLRAVRAWFEMVKAIRPYPLD